MTCTEARQILLGADLATVGSPEGLLADHLAACAPCRAAAARILVAHEALRDAVPDTRQPAELAAARAIAEGRALVRRRRLARRMIPALVAAAAIAVVLLTPGEHVTPGAVSPGGGPSSRPPLVAGAPANVAVIATGRPDITVIWQF